MQYTPPRKRSQRPEAGFTLVELMVVVSIIALLISILTPSLSQARHEARIVACMSNQRQIMVSMELYAKSFDGSWPAPTNADGDQFWHLNHLYPFLYPRYTDLDPTPDELVRETIFACPSANEVEASTGLQRSYGMNAALLTDGTDPTANFDRYINPNTIRAPSATGVTMDNQTPTVWYQNGDTLAWASSRHNGWTVVGFADTHANRIQTERLYFNDDPNLDQNNLNERVFWFGK